MFVLISSAYLHLLSCSFRHRSDPADVRRNASVRNLNKSTFPELNKDIELDRNVHFVCCVGVIKIETEVQRTGTLSSNVCNTSDKARQLSRREVTSDSYQIK
jgi:hypothetical protein